ncbi:rhodanese-like domain-containing protein [Candidatus Woesearchaeota archaeon]|nr:rhodanese-like domain-containing protein [Candidatus Woesearchaeota archaeon]
MPANKGTVKFFDEKLKYEIDPYSVRKIVDSKDKEYLVVDVRDKDSYKAGHVPTSINVPAYEVDKYIKKLPKNKTLITYCYHVVCYAAPKVALKLAKKGYKVMEMVGGFDEWKKHGHPVEK